MKKKKHGIVFKIVMVILIIIGITLLSVAGWLISVMGGLNRAHSSNEINLGEGKKQALIIYQPSNNDTTTNITMALAKEFVNQDYRVTINYPSKKLNYDLDSYDVIAFGTPVYMGKISSQIKQYVSNKSIKNKAILLYVTGMNLDQQGELKEMAAWFDASNQIDGMKIGKAEPALMKWFLEQCSQSWKTHNATGYFEIHDPTNSNIDAVTGATMKKE